MKLNKSTWTKAKLLDVVTKIEENDRKNAHARFDRFLKVAHMDAESLHIKRFASQENGDEINPTFYKIFRKGQILFPTRNPHLRRTALATFDGICGEKTLTLEANPALILPEFIPFLFHGESFYAHTTSSIIGSTNPHCRWRDVASYEFLLPPKEQQAEIAKLLWAADTLIDNSQKVLNSLILLDLTLLKFHFYDDSSSKRERLKNIVSMKKGKKPSVLNDVGEGLPYATVGYLRVGEVEKIVPAEAWENLIRVNESDILVLWDGSNAGEILYGKDGFLASTMCKLELTNDNYIRDFIFQFLRFRENDIRRATVGSAIPHVDPGIIENIQIPSLNIKKQKEAVMSLKEVNDNIDLTKEHITHQKRLQKSLINQIF